MLTVCPSSPNYSHSYVEALNDQNRVARYIRAISDKEKPQKPYSNYSGPYLRPCMSRVLLMAACLCSGAVVEMVSSEP